jgi:F-type H+-transporting ATPase subunit b
MLIDWFTICAQAINFLILVWLMKHFLYKPILNAIDAREKRIAAELADADTQKAQAQKERDEFQHKNADFDQQRTALLSKATDEANAERLRLLDAARKASDALSARRQETLRNDAHNLNQAITRLTQQEVFAITRKALADLATTRARCSRAACERWMGRRKQDSPRPLRQRLTPRSCAARLTCLRSSAP